MVLLIEAEIQKLLSQEHSYFNISKKLLKNKEAVKHIPSFLSICKFMYLSGEYELLIQTSLSQLKKKKVLPWAFIIQILEDQKTPVSKTIQAAFIAGLIEQKQVEFCLNKHKWDNTHPKFKNLKIQQIQQINIQKNKDMLRLTEELDFVQKHNIIQKEEEILKKLKIEDPHNPDIKEKWLQYLEKWGRNLIKAKKSDLLNPKNFFSEDSKTENALAQHLRSSVKTILKKSPQSSYNISIMFYFIGYPLLALQILKNNLNDQASHWLYLDLLMQSKLYLNTLEFLDIMEKQHHTDPETIFALTYIRAQAFYKLGKKDKAKNILSCLLKVRPHYRLAHQILKQWESGESSFD